MRRFNANWALTSQLRTMVQAAGITLPPAKAYRDKVEGFMGTRGTYQVGACVIDTDGHYYRVDEERHFALKTYHGKDASWHLAADDAGRVFYTPSGFFKHALDTITDWEATPFTLENSR